MCGIAGTLTPEPSPDNIGLIRRIVDSQVHRGPDHQAVKKFSLTRGQAVLGHDRLSIIDLSDQAHQPLSDHTGKFHLVFNGEIYNYIEIRQELASLGARFQTRSDSEVIIEAYKNWGTDAFQRFNGMFAFALLDTENNRLILCRDRFGVKPLYYRLNQSSVVFASTARIIAQTFGLAPDLRYISRGMSYWFYEDDSELCQYEGLLSLPPGTFAEFRLSGDGKLEFQVHRFYSLHDRVADLRERLLASPNRDRLIQEVDEQLQNAVRIRLRSDVPVGISLSGGVDSSLTAALASQEMKDLQGFTFGDPNAEESEGPAVAALARSLGIEVHYIWPGTQEVIKEFEHLIQLQDAPFPTASIIGQYFVFKKAKENRFKVLLGGQGGDEGYLGYRKFYPLYVLDRWKRRDPVGLVRGLTGAAMMFSRELPQLGHYWQAKDRFLKDSGLGHRIRLDLNGAASYSLTGGSQSNLSLRQEADILKFSLPTLLRYEDRNSMGNSIESRLPFMDYRVLEFGAALPTALKLKSGFGKWILRRIAEKRGVPGQIHSNRMKRGFDVNLARWISEGLGDHIRSLLKSFYNEIHEFFPHSRDSIDTLFSDTLLVRHKTAFHEAIVLIWLANTRPSHRN